MKTFLQKTNYLYGLVFLLGTSIAFGQFFVLNRDFSDLEKTAVLDAVECGRENFDNSSFLGNSYSSGSFTGQNNQLWNFVDVRGVSTYGIDGKGALMKSGSSLSSTLTGGIGDFKVKARKAFTTNTKRKLELWIDGVLIEVFEPVFTAGVDTVVSIFKVDNINAAGTVSIELKSAGAQITVDDMEWTCFPSASAFQTKWNGVNWSNGLPTIDKDVVVDASYISSGNLAARTITVSPTGRFVLESGYVLTVGTIENQGHFEVRDGASLVQSDSAVNIGKVKIYKRTVPIKRLDYVFWGSPVSGQNLFGFSPHTIQERFYRYSSFDDVFSNAGIDTATSFLPGTAFAIRAPNHFSQHPQVLEALFEGVPNNGSYTVPVNTVGGRFNLIGNPYPSGMDADFFLAANPNLSGAIYFYTNTNAFDEQTQAYVGNNYAIYNATGAVAADNSAVLPTAFIGLGQGFIVQANSGSDALFTNAMRVASDTGLLNKKSVALEKHRIWIRLTTAGGSESQSLIGYVEGATNQKDRLFDAVHLTQDTNSITSLLNDESLSIQARPLPFDEDDVIPLRFRAASSGHFSLDISNKDGVFADLQKVYLNDLLTGQTVVLTNAKYDFTSPSGTFDNRFSLAFKEGKLSVQTMLEKAPVVVHQNNQILYVDSSNRLLTEVTVFDLAGKLIYQSRKISTHRFELPYSQFSKGVYFIRIQDDSGRATTQKVKF